MNRSFISWKRLKQQKKWLSIQILFVTLEWVTAEKKFCWDKCDCWNRGNWEGLVATKLKFIKKKLSCYWNWRVSSNSRRFWSTVGIHQIAVGYHKLTNELKLENCLTMRFFFVPPYLHPEIDVYTNFTKLILRIFYIVLRQFQTCCHICLFYLCYLNIFYGFRCVAVLRITWLVSYKVPCALWDKMNQLIFRI